MADSVQRLFNISLPKIDSLYGVLEEDINAEIQRMRLLGISDAEIYARLETNLNGSMDLFGRFKGALEKEFDTTIGTTAQLEQNSVLEGMQDLTWQLDPTVQEHCPDCLRNAGSQPKSFDDWALLGLPGAGNTQCGAYCKCSLEP